MQELIPGAASTGTTALEAIVSSESCDVIAGEPALCGDGDGDGDNSAVGESSVRAEGVMAPVLNPLRSANMSRALVNLSVRYMATMF